MLVLVPPLHEARAAEAIVLVVSRKRLIGETEYARLLDQAEASLAAELQARIDRVKEALSVEEKELARLRGELDQEIFKSRVTAFDRKVRAERRKAQKAAARLQNAFRAERVKMLEAIGPLLAAIREDRGASVIIDRDQVLAVDPGIDITDEVIARLNASLPPPTIPDLDTIIAGAGEEGAEQ